MAQRRPTRRMLLALGLALVLGLAARAQPPAGERPPGDRPVALHADRVATWEEGGRRVLALDGGVLIEHADQQLRAARAVAWVDLEAARDRRVNRLTVYAEGDVRLRRGPDSEEKPEAVLELVTRGELRVRSHHSKVERRSLADSPFYRRALARAGKGGDPGAAGEVRQASGVAGPAASPPDPGASGAPEAAPAQRGPEPELLLPAPPITPPPGGEDPPPGPGASPGPAPPGAPAQVELPLPAGGGATRTFQYAPRYSVLPNIQFINLDSGEQAAVVTGGVILTVRFPEEGRTLDIEADRLVAWTRGVSTQELFRQMRGGGGQPGDRELEFYLSGNVEIRTADERPRPPGRGPGFEAKVLRADRVYYDVKRNRAIAVRGDLEIAQPGLPDNAHFRAEEIWQLARNEYQALNAEIFSSRLPSNPGLKLTVREAHLREQRVPVRNLLFQPYRNEDGTPLTEVERIYTGRNSFLEVADVPVLYFPYVRGDVNDPLGPLESFGLRQDQIFGFQALTTWDLFEILRLRQPAGHRWRLYADYLSERGPAAGTNYSYSGLRMFGVPSEYSGFLEAYGIYDQGFDQLGGPRSEFFDPPQWRGRVLYRHVQWLGEYDFQGQVAYLSDTNFLEQYYKLEHDMGPDQETFAYLKRQRGNLAGTVLVEANTRDWVNQTEWWPKADAYWLGASFLDRLTHNAWAGAGYADLETTERPPPPLLPTTVPIDTGRLHLGQELAAPFGLGPLKVVPYSKLDLAYYSRDLTGDDRGRFWGGAGVRAGLPLSRLYPGAASELLNVNGLYHKIVLGANYFASHTDVPFTQLPELDRLNDDATDQSVRDMTLRQVTDLGPVVGSALAAPDPRFNPQLYAIRRLVDTRVDTLGKIQVVQLDVRQRLQTKRGFPGMEHTVDWLTLDFSMSLFPDSVRDNFGEAVGLIEYFSTWNVGDETALVSSGWFDPFELGARYYTVGAFYSRPDRTYYYLGYRSIDPLQSRALTGAVTYVFSPKYAVTAAATYDFGIQEAMSNQLVFTRVGTDVQLSLGFTYDAIIQNFGVTFEVVPNIVAAGRGPRLLAQRSPALGVR